MENHFIPEGAKRRRLQETRQQPTIRPRHPFHDPEVNRFVPTTVAEYLHLN